jgi:hypothetical protein
MLVRRLALFVVLGLVLVGLTAGVSASSSKGGFKLAGVIPPFPPLLKVPLSAVCKFSQQGSTTFEVACWSQDPNPNPPKDRASEKIACDKKMQGTLTAYPNGDVFISCRLRL